jgi:hypothetical protein
MLTLGTTTTTASPCSTCLINGTSCATACRSSNSYGSYGGVVLTYPGSSYVCGSIVTSSSTTLCTLTGGGYNGGNGLLSVATNHNFVPTTLLLYTYSGTTYNLTYDSYSFVIGLLTI